MKQRFSIQVTILMSFLLVLMIACGSIIYYNYTKTSASFMNDLEADISRTTEVILGDVESYLVPAKVSTQIIAWFSKNEKPDLAFFDIQLADGSSFEIFKQIHVPCPVIFTTAYDAYALKAFQVNSIDYLLKPIDLDDLKGAFRRYEELKANFQKEETENDSLEQIRRAMQMIKKEYKQRFIIKSGSHLSTVQVQDVLFFYSEHKTVWLKHKNGKRHAIDYTLEQLEGLLNTTI